MKFSTQAFYRIIPFFVSLASAVELCLVELVPRALAVQIAINLNQSYLPNATDASPHHDAASTIGGFLLNSSRDVVLLLISILCNVDQCASSENRTWFHWGSLHCCQKHSIVTLWPYAVV